MMKWLRKHRYHIFLITVIGFIAGSFMGFGSYYFTRSPYDAAIVVNGQKISYKRYQTRYRQYQQERQNKKDAPPPGENDAKALRQEALQDLVREAVFSQEAEKYGITVTDNELSAYLQRAPAFQKDGKFDPNVYLQVVTQIFRVSPDEFEADRRRELRIHKLQMLLAGSVKMSPLELNWRFQKLMATGTAADKKDLKEKPNDFREKLRQEQASYVMQEWLQSINTRLKVKVYLDKWEGKEG